jgi:PII-like signaling protein
MSESAFVERHPAHLGKRLTIFVNPRDRVGHKSIFFEILKWVRKAELSGATVFQGHLGYGNEGRLRHTHLLSEDSTQAIVIIDLPERIDSFLHDIRPLTSDVFVVVDDVEIIET